MKAVLRKDHCIAVIEVRPEGLTDNKSKEIDNNANLHLALATVLSSVAEKTIAKEIWDALTRLYETKSLYNKILLKIKLYTLRMSESISASNHINNLNTLFSKVTVMDYNMQENEDAKLRFQSLPDLYDQLIINLTNNMLMDFIDFK